MGFEIINVLKKKKGLTNAQLAELSGVTLSTIDKITSGVNTNPKLDTLLAICEVLGCTLNDFGEHSLQQKSAPEGAQLRDEDIMFALFDGDGEITDDMFDEVKDFARFIQERERKKAEKDESN